MKFVLIVDIAGIYGSLLNYAMVLFFVGSAMLVFTYLWWTGKLGMTEEPKYRMMDDDEKEKKDDRSK